VLGTVLGYLSAVRVEAEPGDLSQDVTRTGNIIRKNRFRSGAMASSEWTCSVRVVRDTPEADYSETGVITMRRIVYCPRIAVSPFRCILSVSYFK
jgi:hypothetical protein